MYLGRSTRLVRLRVMRFVVGMSVLMTVVVIVLALEVVVTRAG